MLFRAFAAASALLVSSLSPAATEENVPPWQHPEIVRVVCPVPGGWLSGSAFRIGPNILLSVAHVTSAGTCEIDGEKVKVIETQGDFVILHSEIASNHWLKVDCGGFVSGKKYEAIGYARGRETQTTVDVTATGEKLNGFARLTGVFTVIPGQSGGAMLDSDTGAVVGTVNVYNAERGDSGSVELKNTPVCRQRIA